MLFLLIVIESQSTEEQNPQKEALRECQGTEPSEPLFKQLGWTSIEQRIKYEYLLVSRCLKNEAPVYLKK
jgi:hypothetical protein